MNEAGTDTVSTLVGTDRLPDFEDRESLPYLECVIKELYRYAWHLSILCSASPL